MCEHIPFHERLVYVKQKIHDATIRSGRMPDQITLVAVSKFHSVDAIREAYGCGQINFGENYVQEAMEKQSELIDCPNIEWHFIGHVQHNKAKYVAGKFKLIHTIDDVNLADAISSRIPDGVTQDVLLQVNLGDEPQKSGVSFDEVLHLANEVLSVPKIKILGLMGMPPIFDSGEEARPFFAKLRECRDKLKSETGLDLPHLSMGMSGDFEQAIEEGATIVRIGTSLFGSRPQKSNTF